MGTDIKTMKGHLRRIAMFEHLDEEVLDKLAAIAHEESFEEGAILFNEGDTSDALYLVVEGSAVVQKLLDAEAGTFKDMNLAEAGGMFGEMALFDQKPRSARVKALGKMHVLRITHDEFQAFLHGDTRTAATVLGGIINLLSSRLRESDQHMALIYEVGNIISSAHEASDIANRIMERLIGTVFHVDAGAFCMWNVWMDECDVLYSKGVVAAHAACLGISRNGPMAAFMREQRKPQVMQKLAADHPLRQAFCLDEADSMLVAPLIYQDDMLGFILLAGRDATFTSFHQILVSSVCSQVASAITNLAYAKDAECRDRLETAKIRQAPVLGRL
jgi:CRP-like cAMP-binding protein